MQLPHVFKSFIANTILTTIGIIIFAVHMQLTTCLLNIYFGHIEMFSLWACSLFYALSIFRIVTNMLHARYGKYSNVHSVVTSLAGKETIYMVCSPIN